MNIKEDIKFHPSKIEITQKDSIQYSKAIEGKNGEYNILITTRLHPDGIKLRGYYNDMKKLFELLGGDKLVVSSNPSKGEGYDIV